jgi:hypothetical protein
MPMHQFDKNQSFTSLDTSTDFRSEASIMNPQQSIYNHNNPDIAAAERLALEQLRIAGAWVTVLTRTEDNKYDKTWNEDSDPTYYTGYDFKAFFEPQAPEVALTKFGIDSPNKFDLVFSRAWVLEKLGNRLFRNGDVVIVPHNSLVINATRFRVVHVADSGNFRYRWIYLNVTVENMNNDESLAPRV